MKKICSLILVAILLVTNLVPVWAQNNKTVVEEKVVEYGGTVTNISEYEFKTEMKEYNVKSDSIKKVNFNNIEKIEKKKILTDLGIDTIYTDEEINCITNLYIVEEPVEVQKSLTQGLTSAYSAPSGFLDTRYIYADIRYTNTRVETGLGVWEFILNGSVNVLLGMKTTYLWIPLTVLGINASDFIPTSDDKLTIITNKNYHQKIFQVYEVSSSMWIPCAIAERVDAAITNITTLLDKNSFPYNDTKTTITPSVYSAHYNDNDFLNRTGRRYYSEEIWPYVEHAQ